MVTTKDLAKTDKTTRGSCYTVKKGDENKRVCPRCKDIEGVAIFGTGDTHCNTCALKKKSEHFNVIIKKREEQLSSMTINSMKSQMEEAIAELKRQKSELEKKGKELLKVQQLRRHSYKSEVMLEQVQRETK